ncbi:MAG: hypothetical protein Q4C00_03130 [Bacillota bacterium]|nr:hypothetical protein [Bacillota bacterium]
MKKSIFAILAVVLMMFSACSGNSEEQAEDSVEVLNKEDVSAVTFTETEDSTGYTVLEIPTTLPADDYDIGSIAFYNDTFYYALTKTDPMGENMVACDIVAYNTITQESEVVFTVPNEKFWLNELKATENALFWVMEENREYRIETLDILNNEVSTVKVLEQGGGVLLETDGEFLTWYEYQGDDSVLNAYDISAKTEKTIITTKNSQSPYTRCPVNNGVIAYFAPESDYQRLSLYDLKAEKLIKDIFISADFKVAQPQGNRNFVLWVEENEAYPNTPIYVYSLDRDELLLVEDSAEDSSVFATWLGENEVFLVDSQKQTISCRDLATQEATQLIYNEGDEFSYYLSHPTPNGDFIALNMLEKTLILIQRP